MQCSYDYLKLRGEKFCGDDKTVLEGFQMMSGEDIEFSSDGSVEGAGWSLCLGEAPTMAPTDPPEKASDLIDILQAHPADSENGGHHCEVVGSCIR